MQRLNTLKNWQTVKPKEEVILPIKGPRNVRLQVNAPAPARIYIKPDTKDGKPVFLALVTGLDLIEFQIKGPHTITADAEFNIFTAEGRKIHIENTGAPAFTEIVERQARNPEFERMMERSQINAMRMMAKLQQENEKQMQALMARVNNNDQTNEPVTTGDTSDGEPASEPDTDAQSPIGSSEAPPEGNGAENNEGG